MEAIIAVIIQYASIWAPSLVAILGVITTVVKLRGEIAKFKSSETVQELKDKILELERKVEEKASKEEELIRVNKMLIDQITQIRDYADHKKGG